jgi:hypothetical protein
VPPGAGGLASAEETMPISRLAAITVSLAVAFGAAATAARAQEKFAVEGTNPGSTKVDYKGEVSVQKTGETWQFEWQVGGAPIKGTGIIMDGTHVAVAGLFEGKPFVFILKKDGAKYVGTWTLAGGDKIGREVWTPK